MYSLNIKCFFFICAFLVLCEDTVLPQSRNSIFVVPNGGNSGISLFENNRYKISSGQTLMSVKNMSKYDEAEMIGIIQDYGIVIYKKDTFLVKIKEVKSKDGLSINEFIQKIRNDDRKALLECKIKELHSMVTPVNGDVYAKANELFVSNSFIDDDSRIINKGDDLLILGYNNDTIYFNKDFGIYFTVAKNLNSELTNNIQAQIDKIKEDEYRKEQLKLQEIQREKEKKLAKLKQELFQKSKELYGEKCAKAIIEEKIYIGMPSGAVKLSWGKPIDINRTISKYGTREQWVYGNGCYLYFDDGILETIQD